MHHLYQELEDHFCLNVLSCASRLQSACPNADISDPSPMTVYTADQFGRELLQCMQGLSPAKVMVWFALKYAIKLDACNVIWNCPYINAECLFFYFFYRLLPSSALTLNIAKCLGML